MSAIASSAASESVLQVQIERGIATLRLNRPQQYNSLSTELLSALQRALDEVAADETIQVVVIAANGKAFCAGHDLKEVRSREDREFHQDLFGQSSKIMLTINRMPQPVIAQVQGIATAAGCLLVAACDLAVAAESARFAVSGINLGLFCSSPAVPLSRNVNRKQAMKMLLTGDFIDPHTAERYGLVNDVVPDADLARTTRELAENIAAKSPLSIRLGKKMFYAQLVMDLEAACRFACERMARNMDSDDAREGFDAFIEKRKPTWKGC
jgi:enoyl-CoA hydratase/carnithine racemase